MKDQSYEQKNLCRSDGFSDLHIDMYFPLFWTHISNFRQDLAFFSTFHRLNSSSYENAGKRATYVFLQMIDYNNIDVRY